MDIAVLEKRVLDARTRPHGPRREIRCGICKQLVEDRMIGGMLRSVHVLGDKDHLPLPYNPS